MFKSEWEKTESRLKLAEGFAAKAVASTLPGETISRIQQISGGCANLNFKVVRTGERSPLLLRVYLRDPKACKREAEIGKLLCGVVPAPHLVAQGIQESIPFALFDFMEGIALRDLLLSDLSIRHDELMNQVGAILARINNFTFDNPGFLNEELVPNGDVSAAVLSSFVFECLSDSEVIESLGPSLTNKLRDCIKKLGYYFPEPESKLVHGDFDPANILVVKVGDTWKISGILDWEFAFSGSVLCDVANMLRYAHKMSPWYQESFLKGIAESGLVLPADWQVSTILLNIVSLLDCLRRADLNRRPKQAADIVELLNWFVKRLQKEEKENGKLN